MLSKNILRLAGQDLNKAIYVAYSSVSNKTQATAAAAAQSATPVENNLKSIDDIPGPKIYPVIGSLLSDVRLGGDLDFTNNLGLSLVLQKKYGDIVRVKFFDFNLVHLFDPELAKKVFQAAGDMPNRIQAPVWLKYSKYRNLPLTLVNSNDERWRRLRTASNPIAGRPQNVQQFLTPQDQIVDDLMNLINEQFDANSNVKTFFGFENQLKTVSLDLVSVIAFNERLNCIREENRDPAVTAIVNAMDEFFVTSGYLMMNMLPYGPYFPTKMWRRHVAASDTIFGTSRKFVKEAYSKLMQKKEQQTEESKTKTILEQYILTMDKHGLTLDDVVALTSDFLLGGIDTTTSVFHYLVYEIGRRPDVQQQLYEEIKANYNGGALSDEILAKLPYLKAVVKETLRVHPVLSGTARILREDIALAGYLIPKGTCLTINAAYTATSECYFKNADSFEPKRWLKNEKDKDSHNPYAYLPFGMGARQCIGRRIAEQEIYLLTTKLIYNFQVEYIGQKIGYQTRLIASPDKPLDIKLTRRTASI